MDTSTQKHILIVVSLLAATALILAFQKAPRRCEDIGVRLELPEAVGDYHGKSCLFCQNTLCARNRVSIDDNGEKICPLCGSALSDLSIAEKAFLPPDTIVIKKQYKNDAGEAIFAFIVATGRERTSIHRPELCLPAQGQSIEDGRTILVDIRGHDQLRAMLLDLRTVNTDSVGIGQERFSAYAYWFVSQNCETPYHLERVLRMSIDRAFHGVSYRWAYIAVATNRRKGTDDHIHRISKFISDLYPLISLNKRTAQPAPPR